MYIYFYIYPYKRRYKSTKEKSQEQLSNSSLETIELRRLRQEDCHMVKTTWVLHQDGSKVKILSQKYQKKKKKVLDY